MVFYKRCRGLEVVTTNNKRRTTMPPEWIKQILTSSYSSYVNRRDLNNMKENHELMFYSCFIGAMMMPSRVLSYLQMGHFLMLVMTLGWAFSTFFFQALCCTIGPQGDWGQFSWSGILSCCCGRKSKKAHPREETKLLRDEGEPRENWVEMNSIGEKSTAFNGEKTTTVWQLLP